MQTTTILKVYKNNYLFSPKHKMFLFISDTFAQFILAYLKLSELNKKNDTKIKEIYFNLFEKENIYYLKKFYYYKEIGIFGKKEFKSEKINADIIQEGLLSNAEIIFGITENCNLKCKYCAYEEFYIEKDLRDKNELDIEKTKKILENYFNLSKKKQVTIAFYGGEPLLKFDFVKDIIEFNETKYSQIIFHYSMVTNGTLLNKYIDYLVDKQVQVDVSLDGDKIQNSFRIFKNNLESFDVVYNNLIFIKQNYPDFFSKKIRILSTKHSKNNNGDNIKFIKEHFDKNVIENELRNVFIKDDKVEIHKKIFDVNKNKQPFLDDYFSLSYYNLNEIKIRKTPFHNGTCFPFFSRMYISSDYKILPCEKISTNFNLGKINSDGGIEINFEEVALYMNNLNKNLEKFCSKCYLLDCKVCLFNVEEKNNVYTCSSFLGKKDFKKEIEKKIKNFIK